MRLSRLPLICDFCGAAAPGWYYPAGTFDGPDRTRSMGDLLACDECHRLIEAGKRAGLAERAVLNPAVRQHGIDPELANLHGNTRESCTTGSLRTGVGTHTGSRYEDG